MRELDKILDEKEKIFWEGKPNFWPFFASSFIISAFGLIFLFAGLVVLIASIIKGEYMLIFFPHFWVGLALVVGAPLYRYLVYGHTYYAITHKRILFQKGVIGRDFEMVDFDKVTNAEVNVGLFDKLFSKNSGSIMISTAGSFVSGRHGPVARPYVLANIPDPYKIFKLFKKVSHAVKTDIEYPNAYRPKNNPGYNSELKLKK